MHQLEANAPSQVPARNGALILPQDHGLKAVLMRTVSESGRALSSRGSWRRPRQLATANRRKDELLAMVCYELRTPLASIRQTVRLLDNLARDTTSSLLAHACPG